MRDINKFIILLLLMYKGPRSFIFYSYYYYNETTCPKVLFICFFFIAAIFMYFNPILQLLQFQVFVVVRSRELLQLCWVYVNANPLLPTSSMSSAFVTTVRTKGFEQPATKNILSSRFFLFFINSVLTRAKYDARSRLQTAFIFLPFLSSCWNSARPV